MGNSMDAPGVSDPPSKTSLQVPLAPPSQVGSTGKAPLQPPTPGSRKRKIELLKANVTRQMGQLSRVVEGVTIDHDKDSILATFSMSKRRASKPIQSLNDEAEEQDDPPRKVMKVTFASDDDLGSPLAKSKPVASVPQENGDKLNGEEDPDREPDEESDEEPDAEDDDEDEPNNGDSQKGGNPGEIEEDEESSSKSEEEDEDNMLEDSKGSLIWLPTGSKQGSTCTPMIRW